MMNSERADCLQTWGPLALLLAIVALAWCAGNDRWSSAAWGVPTAYLEPEKGDVVHALAIMKAVSDGEFVPLAWKKVDALGAPSTANWNDFPMVEELLGVFFGLLGQLFGLFGGLNVGTIIAHLSAAAAFYIVARWEDCDLPWALVAALAYGLAPFIFAQSPFHITTEYVWHVPLFLPIWRWIATAPGLVWGTRRFWFALALGFITGLQSPYWTNILCQLTLLSAGIAYCRNGSWPALKSALAVIASAAVAFALMNVDTWTYRLAEGPNPGVLSREYKWMEIYGLKLVDLVIPPPTHNSDAFAAFAIEHKIGDPARGIPPASPLQDEGSYLGIVGLLALGWLAWTAVYDAVKGRANDIPLAAWQVLWIVLCFTTGGLNAILGAFGFTLFRTGQRYSIVIMAIALLYAAQRLTGWQRRSTGVIPADQLWIMVLTAASAIGLVILWDQVPRAPSREQTATLARQVEADREFTGKMEAALPAGAMVFQMPVMEFPESPLPGVPSYDHFRPYLYSKNLRFSFGSMKGREREKWQAALQAKFFESATLDQQTGMIRVNEANARAAIDELKRLGFTAIYVNRNGFPDRGKGIEEVLLALGYEKPPIRTATGDLACFILQ
jgi:hypothetical protein